MWRGDTRNGQIFRERLHSQRVWAYTDGTRSQQAGLAVVCPEVTVWRRRRPVADGLEAVARGRFFVGDLEVEDVGGAGLGPQVPAGLWPNPCLSAVLPANTACGGP